MANDWIVGAAHGVLSMSATSVIVFGGELKGWETKLQHVLANLVAETYPLLESIGRHRGKRDEVVVRAELDPRR